MSSVLPENTASIPAATMTTAEALTQATLAHQAGQLIDAERLYQAILKTEPANPDALHNLGLIAMACSNAPAAVPWFQAALEAQPENPRCWLSLAEALLAAGQVDDARTVINTGRGAGLHGQEADMLEVRIISAWMALRAAE